LLKNLSWASLVGSASSLQLFQLKAARVSVFQATHTFAFALPQSCSGPGGL